MGKPMTEEMKEKLRLGREAAKQRKAAEQKAQPETPSPSAAQATTKGTEIILGAADYQIFGQVDLNKSGKVSSTYPSWYFDHFREGLQEEIKRDQYMLEHDLVPKSELGVARERLKQKKDKLLSLENAIPEISGKTKDAIYGFRNELGDKIKESKFSRSDMQKGIADAHEEARRMASPCIELRGNALDFARKCNVKVDDRGMVSRTGAEKVWKIASRIIGEPSNTEILRRD